MLETINSSSQDFVLQLSSHDFGGCAIDSTGQPLPESTLKACREADAILMGKLLGSAMSVYLNLDIRFCGWSQMVNRHCQT